MLGQRRRCQMRFCLHIRVQRDDSIVCFVVARQTAESFAGTTASATAAAFLQLLRLLANGDAADVMRKMFANDLCYRFGIIERRAFGVPVEECFCGQNCQSKTICSDAFRDLLKMKFDAGFLPIGNAGF